MADRSERYDVTTRDGMVEYYRAAFADVYASAARLTNHDRQAAEDLVHDAFFRLLRSVKAGDTTSVNVGWAITAVRRLFIDRLRSSMSERRRQRLVAVPAAAPTDTHAIEAGGVLDGLSEREQAALILRYVEDLPVAEVADLMNSSMRATESLLQRAKRRARANGGAA